MTAEGEMGRIAEQLIELAADMQRSSSRQHHTRLMDNPGAGTPLVDVARQLAEQRRSRKVFMSAALFHEPAWDLLLMLFIAHEDGRTLGCKDLVAMVDAPVTTSQRWIDQLVHMRMLTRETDDGDRRRVHLGLSEKGQQAMTRYLRSLLPCIPAACSGSANKDPLANGG